MREADPKALGQLLREECPGHYGRQTAERLVQLAECSVSSGQATQARQRSMRILCDQLEHTQSNLKRLQQEIECLLDNDPKVKGVLSITELGPMTVAVLRAELGDLDRFARMDPRGGLRGLGFAGQTKWQMERTDQIVQAWQWPTSPHLVSGGSQEHSLAYLSLWDLLPSPGGTWHEKRDGRGSGYAQTSDRCYPSDANAGGL